MATTSTPSSHPANNALWQVHERRRCGDNESNEQRSCGDERVGDGSEYARPEPVTAWNEQRQRVCRSFFFFRRLRRRRGRFVGSAFATKLMFPSPQLLRSAWRTSLNDFERVQSWGDTPSRARGPVRSVQTLLHMSHLVAFMIGWLPFASRYGQSFRILTATLSNCYRQPFQHTPHPIQMFSDTVTNPLVFIHVWHRFGNRSMQTGVGGSACTPARLGFFRGVFPMRGEETRVAVHARRGRAFWTQ